jgi:hypothetical protein
VRPIRVVIRTSRTESRPRAGNAVSGHVSTVAAGHGAKGRTKTPESGWASKRHRSPPSSAPVITTTRTARGMRACHSPFSRERTARPERAVATATASRRDAVVICHPGVPAAGSAHGLRHPLHGLCAGIVLSGGITSSRCGDARLRSVVVHVHVHGACVPCTCRREARGQTGSGYSPSPSEGCRRGPRGGRPGAGRGGGRPSPERPSVGLAARQ